MSPRSTATSKRPEAEAPPGARRLVVSFHDLHPGSREVCARFLARLRELGVPRASLLVVPCWHGGRPLTHDAAFTAWLGELAAAGHDICLHGWNHQGGAVRGGLLARWVARCYTQSEGEFFQISRDEALERVRQGLELLRREAGLPVVGFTPPAWLLSPPGREALVTAGLSYSTTWKTVECLQAGIVLEAPTLVFSCRNAWRRAVSRAWVRLWAWRNRAAPVLRIAAHPGDFADPKVEASLFRLVRNALAAGREPVTYRDLLPEDTRPLPARAAVA